MRSSSYPSIFVINAISLLLFLAINAIPLLLFILHRGNENHLTHHEIIKLSVNLCDQRDLSSSVPCDQRDPSSSVYLASRQ
jgi:hypothetical protein